MANNIFIMNICLNFHKISKFAIFLIHYVTAKTCNRLLYHQTVVFSFYMSYALMSVKAPEAFKSRGSILSTTTLCAVYHMDHKKAFSVEL